MTDALENAGQTGGQKLKLNVKRTIMVGLAFFSISMFWQVYDNIMPMFLLDFGFDYTLRGVIMALDNVLAIVLLPFMGIWSDKLPKKLRSKFGRRIPFIVVGSVLAAGMLLLVNFAHNANILWLLMATTSFLLVFMCLYRSPAVALMPDVTPKPIRSPGNAVINIMGTVGGMVSLLLIQFLTVKVDTVIDFGNGPETVKVLSGSNWALIGIVAGMMVLVAVYMAVRVKENRMIEARNKEMEKFHIVEEPEPATKRQSVRKVLGSLSRGQLISLMYLLLAVFLWFFAYNALTTHYSVFATSVLGEENFTIPLLIANIAAFVMFVPAMLLGKKLGRKRTVLIGIGIMAVALGVGSILMLTVEDPKALKGILYPLFALIGVGWATINVHSYVMCVELSEEHTTGTYTGLYYAFSMTAQVLTPILSGVVVDNMGPRYFILYSFVFIVLAFVTMLFVKHGNAKRVEVKTDTDAEENAGETESL